MKDLIISHVADIDGVSPVILMKLCKINFDFELKEIYEVDEFVCELIKEDLSMYKNIYITDLTILESTYQKINESIYKEKFKVFDHHKTHTYACKYNYVTININECATSIFYKYLKKKYKFKKQVSEYVEHVKNLDLWLFEEKNDTYAKKLGDLFSIYGKKRYIEEMYKKLKARKKFKLSKFEEEILSLEQDRVDRHILNKEKELITIKYENYLGGLVFNSNYRSELGNTLSKRHPELDFIVMINMSGGMSFRTDKDIDISVIAKKLNGGGHAKACGAPIKLEDKINLIKTLFKGCEIIENKEDNNR